MIEQALQDSIAVAGMFEIPTGKLREHKHAKFVQFSRASENIQRYPVIPGWVDKADCTEIYVFP